MPQEEISEEELLLRKRARRRLIGAFVVVIVMVLVLPAVLEDKPQPVARDVSIILPPPVSQPSAVVAPEPAAPPPSAVPPPPPSAPTPTASEPAKTAPVPEAPADKPAVAAKPKPAPSAKPAAEKFHVQVGVFSNSENVKQLQSKLSAQGLKLRTETLADGKIRVRAGPYSSRQEADKVAEQLRATGMQGVVVKSGGDKTSKPR